MKLFYVINGLGPGGAERSLLELLPRYREAGIEPRIICLKRSKHTLDASVRDSGFDVRFVPQSGILSASKTLRRMVRHEKPDLVHTTLFEADVAGRLASWGLRVPVLTSLVNTSYDDARYRDPNIQRHRLAIVQAADAWTARLMTTHFHAITHAVRDSAVAHLGIDPRRITVIERGRDRDRLGFPGSERRRAARELLGLGPTDEVVVNVARQEYQKGQVHLLEAMVRVARERPNAVLLIAGREGHATEELRRVHRASGLGDRIRFLGYRTDVADLLAAADLFVFPSLYEGLGGAVIEAMAMGLPAVASRLPALAEVVEEGASGILVPPASPGPLAEALVALLEDPVRRSAYGRRSREIFEARFTVERCAERMIELYRSLVPEPVGAGLQAV